MDMDSVLKTIHEIIAGKSKIKVLREEEVNNITMIFFRHQDHMIGLSKLTLRIDDTSYNLADLARISRSFANTIIPLDMLFMQTKTKNRVGQELSKIIQALQDRGA